MYELPIVLRDSFIFVQQQNIEVVTFLFALGLGMFASVDWASLGIESKLLIRAQICHVHQPDLKVCLAASAQGTTDGSKLHCHEIVEFMGAWKNVFELHFQYEAPVLHPVHFVSFFSPVHCSYCPKQAG